MVLFKTNFLRLIQYLLRSAKTSCAKTAVRQNGRRQNARAKPVAPNRRRQNVTYPEIDIGPKHLRIKSVRECRTVPEVSSARPVTSRVHYRNSILTATEFGI